MINADNGGGHVGFMQIKKINNRLLQASMPQTPNN